MVSTNVIVSIAGFSERTVIGTAVAGASGRDNFAVTVADALDATLVFRVLDAEADARARATPETPSRYRAGTNDPTPARAEALTR